MSDLDRLLASYADAAKTEREKGTYFERLAVAFLENDPVQSGLYDEVTDYATWAEKQGHKRSDVGIDLVAKLRNDEGYAAIQCKFHDPTRTIQKADIDSFMSASGKEPFRARVVMDTTDVDWGKNAEEMLRGQSVPVTRMGLDELRQSPIDWKQFGTSSEIILRPKKELKPHQLEALEAVVQGFATESRGKLLMACGTGKTFTALRIAEAVAGRGKRVLLLVPSLALIAQSVREWTADSQIPLRSFAVCSDAQVGKRRKHDDDAAEIEVHELAFPATTQVDLLVEKARPQDDGKMTVIFGTYHSLDVMSRAQKAKDGLPDFDLIICDEAHRTTGAALVSDEESHFVRVHKNIHISSRKRLYMTATPKIYGESTKSKAVNAAIRLCDMDDENLYGPVFFERGFGWAVEQDLLTDYKVVVLAVSEEEVSRTLQRRLSEGDELKLDDATKIIGCYRALQKYGREREWETDSYPMRRAIAFCRGIDLSKLVAAEFSQVVEEFEKEKIEKQAEVDHLHCEVKHVDGTFNAKTRGALLNWLAEEPADNTCRILSNARCLSEGVDVPALDAIVFMHPRKSQIDVVQSVGRVMRKAKGKKLGYVIIPVVVAPDVDPAIALNNNERYQVVWQILNALRSHDESLDAKINRQELGEDISGKIEIIAITNWVQPSSKEKEIKVGTGNKNNDPPSRPKPGVTKRLVFDKLPAAILAKIVQKCGTRAYWTTWAGNIADITQAHILRIKAAIDSGTREREIFDAFLTELRDDLNKGVTEEEAVEMLAQHLITRPVFDALFDDYDFSRQNPVSVAIQKVVDVLEPQNLGKEAEELKDFYEGVRRSIFGIKKPDAKQRIMLELYDNFFSKAFPKLVERLGIVYTPVEVVDFILHSVNDILQEEFGQTLGSKGVHIIDPFTGTGTFMARLLQSGLIAADQLEHKYKHELHANEIILLAYYIATINIESAYHSERHRGTQDGYFPFEGICLTDTFELHEKDDLVDQVLPDNSERRKRQKSLGIRVIIGNPPYSAGQGNANDNAANQSYPTLDASIRSSYALHSEATNKNALYDSYIRAIRWGSERLGETGGIIGFVTNAGWIDGNAMDGMRKCLAEEFSSIYVFHLRGNQRTSGERSRREGGKVFGGGSRAPIAINLFVNNPKAAQRGEIHFFDIGDYLTREEKLKKIKELGSIKGITAQEDWVAIQPDEYHDWLDQRVDDFHLHIPIGTKKANRGEALFANYSGGIKTNRDSWCYNPAKDEVARNMSHMVDFYNQEIRRYQESDRSIPAKDFVSNDSTKIKWTRGLRNDFAKGKFHYYDETCIVPSTYRPFSCSFLYYSRQWNDRIYQIPRIFPTGQEKNRVIAVSGIRRYQESDRSIPAKDFVSNDSTKIKWTRGLRNDFAKGKFHYYDETCIVPSTYRPFSCSFLYYSRQWNDTIYQIPRIFPTGQEKNRVIAVSGIGARAGFSALMVDAIPCHDMVEKGQCFPLYLYEEKVSGTDDLLGQGEGQYHLRDGITDVGFAEFLTAYAPDRLTKEDIFYYVYGLLHAPDYRRRFKNNLQKELPHIPKVKKAAGFWAFSKAGRELADLHLGYESIDPHPVTFAKGDPSSTQINDPVAYYRVEKMKFAGKAGNKDRTTVIYNHNITMTDIPLGAYDYAVNGKSALDWVMERQVVKVDKDSGIVNDANRYANETVGNPAYPLELFQRIITVSLATNHIARSLPELDI